MDLITLREMCESLDLTRRTIQCYEQAGLMKATGKNKYGHLLYDEKSRIRAKKIKFLQELGFKLKEIRGIIDAPNDVLLKEVKIKMQKLMLERDRISKLLDETMKLIRELSK